MFTGKDNVSLTLIIININLLTRRACWLWKPLNMYNERGLSMRKHIHTHCTWQQHTAKWSYCRLSTADPYAIVLCSYVFYASSTFPTRCLTLIGAGSCSRCHNNIVILWLWWFILCRGIWYTWFIAKYLSLSHSWTHFFIRLG